MILEYSLQNPIVLGEKPVLLDFYATWCGPCKLTKKNIEEYYETHPDLTVYKIDVDEFEDVADSYNVQSLPTLIYLTDKEELWRHYGLMTVSLLNDMI